MKFAANLNLKGISFFTHSVHWAHVSSGFIVKNEIKARFRFRLMTLVNILTHQLVFSINNINFQKVTWNDSQTTELNKFT